VNFSVTNRRIGLRTASLSLTHHCPRFKVQTHARLQVSLIFLMNCRLRMRQHSRNGGRGFEHRGGGPGRQPLGEMGWLLHAPAPIRRRDVCHSHSGARRERFSQSGEPKMLTTRASEIKFRLPFHQTTMEGYATVCASSHVALGTPLLPDLATFQRRC
jgi:hypothetical protein